jgi:predicted DCC family thiol-disulfide oxidoreductase YuxK
MLEHRAAARRVSQPPSGRPLLVFDGECSFCRQWVERWRAAGAERFEIEPLQSAAERFPELAPAQFEQAVQLIQTDGRVFSAAEAVLRARALATSRGWLLAGYERLPGFASAAETIYRAVARHRPLLSWLTRVFWGAEVSRPSFGISTWLFLRLLGLVHFFAFLSFWTQLSGLVGPQGILPAQPYLDMLHGPLGAARFWQLPTLCWIFGAGGFLHVLCGAGLALSLALIAGFAPARCLILLWADYLSLCAAGQVFLEYQWDNLLIETTLLTIFLVPWARWSCRSCLDPPRLARWLLWWLLFRLILLSGASKLLSGDETWRGFTALSFHFQTQPLPTWVSWYAQQLPEAAKKLAGLLVLVIEIAGPFLLILPRRARHLGAAIQLGFQGLIALTGNYAFFNLLTAALCLLFFDDAFWRAVLGPLGLSRLSECQARAANPRPHNRGRRALAAIAIVYFALTSEALLAPLFPGLAFSAGSRVLWNAVAPFRSLNSYGLFAVMTRERPEIIIEGSNDGLVWLPYEFKAKPGDPRRRPGFIAPLQPRLDWQLWFAALEFPERNPWVTLLCGRLLQASPPVLGLFALNPFPDHPPQFVRAELYDYQFTSPAVRAMRGQWWVRTLIGEYVPPCALRSQPSAALDARPE